MSSRVCGPRGGSKDELELRTRKSIPCRKSEAHREPVSSQQRFGWELSVMVTAPSC
ncbi:hypothetical protein GPEL0_01f0046 [Geoanaerobacter pelophilus]|uniref:Uncharacterized protein n=1 Tax=Geoanaerobacter pelophilus TaxID=60036 RepID=A0ABQ0MDR7_9BACT|nr:hypothetical protein GPEL0_01f0046 [Geoanaerobacter pelophilus]